VPATPPEEVSSVAAKSSPSANSQTSRPPTKAQLRRAAARQAILAATRELVAEEGFAGAQIALIAARANVGVGSVYQHFSSRSSLLAELYETMAGHEFAIVENAVHAVDADAGDTAATSAAKIDAAVTTFCSRALRAGRFAFALLVEHGEAQLDDRRLTFREGYRKLFERILDEGIEHGELPVQNTNVSAAALLGIMTESLVRPLTDGHPKRTHQLVRQIVALCHAAVGAAPLESTSLAPQPTALPPRSRAADTKPHR
jgi:AcrR family transcriptional regulator